MGLVDSQSALVRTLLRQHFREEFVRAHADGGVMRAGIHTTGLRKIMAKIARGGLVYHVGLHGCAAEIRVRHDWELLQVDVAVRTALDAGTATDTPIFNDHFQRALATDRSDRAPHHA